MRLTVSAEAIVSRGISSKFALPKHLQLRDRPAELDQDGFAMFWGMVTDNEIFGKNLIRAITLPEGWQNLYRQLMLDISAIDRRARQAAHFATGRHPELVKPPPHRGRI